MTLEEKQLLLKDLCARLPYGVRIHIHDIDVDDYDRQLIGEDLDFIELDRRNCKPYLRPMSSMTEEEKRHYEISIEGITHDYDFVSLGKHPMSIIGIVDWLNEHHFDYRGLIPMGLALEAPEGMYKTE